jgi:hypothetical protein
MTPEENRKTSSDPAGKSGTPPAKNETLDCDDGPLTPEQREAVLADWRQAKKDEEEWLAKRQVPKATRQSPEPPSQAPEAHPNLEQLAVRGRWHSRPVTYWAGRWHQLCELLPRFALDDFRVAEKAPANPYLKAVVRLPRKDSAPMPVGIVSHTYRLVQHADVANKCLDAIRRMRIEPTTLRCELGLTKLGEWMTLRVFFPPQFGYTARDQHRLDLCLECFNSVEGSSRLVVLFSWVRFICKNGMAIRETHAELSDLHNRNIDLERITSIVEDGLQVAGRDSTQLASWEQHHVRLDQIDAWADKILASAWGKKAACRVIHVCRSGYDVDYADPFAPGEPSQKPVVRKGAVPGARAPAENLYDVSQALAWVASNHRNTEERLQRQAAVPDLVTKLGVIG